MTHDDTMTAATLVTGATGFIGRHIVRRLIADGAPVIALARARNGSTAAARVAAAVGPAVGQVEVVEGDLALPGLGLSPATLARLRHDVARVVHCGGDTTFAPHAVDAFKATLVDGPLELLRMLAGDRLRRWIHISTAFVCGARHGLVREDDGDVGQRFRNTYERMKLASEAVLRAAAQGMDIDLRIVRPSVVVGAGAATPGAHPSTVLFGLIRMTAALAGAALAAPASTDPRPTTHPLQLHSDRGCRPCRRGPRRTRRRRWWDVPRGDPESANA